MHLLSLFEESEGFEWECERFLSLGLVNTGCLWMGDFHKAAILAPGVHFRTCFIYFIYCLIEGFFRY